MSGLSHRQQAWRHAHSGCAWPDLTLLFVFWADLYPAAYACSTCKLSLQQQYLSLVSGRQARPINASACMRLQEVVFGLPKLASRLPQGLVQSQLLPVYRKLTADRVWLVRAAAASTLPAIAGFLPSGLGPSTAPLYASNETRAEETVPVDGDACPCRSC